MIFGSLVAVLLGRLKRRRQSKVELRWTTQLRQTGARHHANGATLILAALILGTLGMPAPAHHAPSGFVYPAECCKGTEMGGDCKPIPADAVHANGDGSYVVIASKEVFYQPGTAPMVERYSPEGGISRVQGKEWRPSPDGQFHRCFMDMSEPAAGTYCLYVVPPGA